MRKKFINLFKKIKAGNEKIDILWQSKEIGVKEYLCILLLLLLFFTFFRILSIFHSSNIINDIFFYLQFISLWLSAFFSIYFLYTSNNLKLKKQNKNIIKLVFKLYLILTLIIISPIIILIAIINIAIKFNAKTVENFQNWLILLSINIVFIILTVEIIAFLTSCITNCILYKYNIQISAPTVIVFLFLGLIKLEMDCISNIIHKIMRFYGIRKIEKRKSSGLPDTETQIAALNDGIDYQKKALWKFQLFMLIFLFIVTAFFPSFWDNYQSEAINALTIFTLLMLYLDKRKEWQRR